MPTEQDHSVMDYSNIEDRVYLGTNACCTAHFTQELLKKGVSDDISLEAERVDQPFGVNCFLWLPTTDHTPPSLQNTLIGVEALAEMLRQERRVHIHCKNGHGRSPTFFAAFLILKRALAVEDAIARIAAKRPEIHIESSQKIFLESLAGRR